MVRDPAADAVPVDRVASTVRRLVAHHGGVVFERDVWLVFRPAGRELQPHGWKLHLSARPSTFPALIDAVVPLLLEHDVPFKLARTIPLLIRINSGTDSPAAVGKAVTIYPPADQVVTLGRRLAERLRGFDGPRVVSDRRVRPDAPVYYRYGPFRADWRSDEFGTLRSQILGPDGQNFAGLAELTYRQPAWVEDPFGSSVPPAGPESAVIADRYRIVGGIQRSVRGSVYRGVRLADGLPVVVKQARAFVGEDHAGLDTRLRLRNERLVLTRLADVAGVPRFIDHLQAGPDELLVLTDEGSLNLVDRLTEHGPYRGLALSQLARELARIVRRVHRAGVLIRDLSPKNVLVSSDETPGPGVTRIVDFGIAATENVAPAGFTSGYSPPAQRQQEPPERWHDCYALGMTLLFAMTGLDPVVADDSWARPRAEETLAEQGDPLGLIGLFDPERAVPTLERIADGVLVTDAARSRPPVVDTGLAADITDHLLAEVMTQAEVILSEADRVRVDATVHRGIAGLGLELLHHLDRRGAGDLVSRLADLAIENARLVELPPGLQVGTTGIGVFLAAARRVGLTDHALVDRRPPSGSDVMLGTAGVGLGHLLRYRITGAAADLSAARELADLLPPEPESAFRAPSESPRTGVDATAGLAHGRAGTALLLTRLAADDPAYTARADAAASALTAELPRLLDLAALPAARPLAVSWCQGLAGVARALLEAGQVLHRRELVVASVQAGQTCLDRVPRLATVGQCCGLTGIGSLLLAQAAERAAAGLPPGAPDVSRQLILRSAGPADRPRFDIRFGTDDISWGYGLTGLLAYFRSVRDGAVLTDVFSAVGQPALASASSIYQSDPGPVIQAD